jgi:hypothetical protein
MKNRVFRDSRIFKEDFKEFALKYFGENLSRERP